MSIDTEDYLFRANISQAETASIIDYLNSHFFIMEFHRYIGMDMDLIKEANRQMIEKSGIPKSSFTYSDFYERASYGDVIAPFLSTIMNGSDKMFGAYYDLKGKSGEEIVRLGFGVARFYSKDFDYSRFKAGRTTPDFGYIWNTNWKSVDLSDKYRIGVYDAGEKLMNLSKTGYPLIFRKICETDAFYARQISEELVKSVKRLKIK